MVWLRGGGSISSSPLRYIAAGRSVMVLVETSAALFIGLAACIYTWKLLCLSCRLPLRSQWDYDNGVGSRVDRFAIDLYLADGTGDCGTWVANLCDKPSIGCKDSSKSSSRTGALSLPRDFCVWLLP